MKKKITSAFSFPEELDMTKRLSEPSQPSLIYDLSAVLIHKGNAVNSGHYIAHIKNENTGQWWEFDDEHVSNLGFHPFGEGSSSNSAKSNLNASVDSNCNGKMSATSNGNHVDGDLNQSSSCVNSGVKIFSSGDAYMLMYKRRHTKQVGKEKHAVCSSDMEIEGDNLSLDADVSQLPHLFDEINSTNASYIDACKNYKINKERETKRITEHRQEVRSILSVAPAQADEEPYYWISAEWLRQWSDNIDPL